MRTRAHADLESSSRILAGTAAAFLEAINRIQDFEEERQLADSTERIRIHVALVTAPNAPSHERAIASLKQWGGFA